MYKILGDKQIEVDLEKFRHLDKEIPLIEGALYADNCEQRHASQSNRNC